MRHKVIVAAALAIAAPASARDLPVPADKGWGHAQTGLVLMPEIAGLPRTGIEDYGERERDVAAHYENAAFDTFATIYLFRPALMSVPIWFDRSSTQVELRESYGGVTVALPPRAFARSGGSVADSLRAVWVPKKGAYKATGLAVMPLGDWLVVVRFDSKILDPAALDDGLDDIIAGIRFPKSATAGPAAALVASCPTGLVFEHAKLKKPDMGNVLVASMLATKVQGKTTDASSKPPSQPPPPLCRDGTPTAQYGVYRAPDTKDGYLLALGDAGLTIDVSTGVSALLGKKEYSVTFNTLDASMVYPGFDRLPEPAQVLDDVQHQSPLARTATREPNKIEIDTSRPPANDD